MTAIHQFLPTFEPSAVGNHTVQVQRALREAGFESEIFAEFVREPLADQAHIHTEYGSSFRAKDDDILLYHLAIGSVVSDFLRTLPQRLVVDYHNITPVEHWQPWEPSVTWGMMWGRRQLLELAPQSVAAIAHSTYSLHELDDLDYRQTSVAPILMDFSAFEHAVDSELLTRLQQTKASGGADLLFVGWVSPHKCQHDIINAFSLYRSMYDPKARLHLVGRSGSETYAEACRQLIKELDLTDSVFMHGGVSDGALGAYYRIADALVCMSEHEGVGIPLLESMYHQVPVVAFAAAAVPETVGDAGIVLPKKNPALVAAAMHRVVTDQSLRKELVRRGTERLQLFTLERNRQRLLDALLPLARPTVSK